MKKIDKFTNQYSLSKTLRFKLIPEGKTAENFDASLMLETDEKRAADYEVVKQLIDNYHKYFIDRVLNTKSLSDIEAYAVLYFKANRTPEDSKKLGDIAFKMRKEISGWFTKDPIYNNLFKKEIFREILPSFLTNEYEKKLVESFSQFSVYFTGFHENRKNLYTGEGKSTEIAFRLVDQNLPKYLDNCRIAQKVFSTLSEKDLNTLEYDMAEIFGVNIHNLENPLHYNSSMSQLGIDIYNQIIGGYSNENGKKIQGFNEYINLYNQTHKDKLPKFKPLYKQILSDCTTVSFIPEAYKSDDEVFQSIYSFMNLETNEQQSSGKYALSALYHTLKNIDNYNPDGIYVSTGSSITDLSNGAFGSWDVIRRGLEAEYDSVNMTRKPKDMDKYIEKRSKFFKDIKSYSINELQNAALHSGVDFGSESILDYISEKVSDLYNDITVSYDELFPLLSEPYPTSKNLVATDSDIGLIKSFLDSVMQFYHFAKMLCGSGDEEGKDELFYGDFSGVFDRLDVIVPLYNKVRNYVTRKPYSDEKIKLNFDNPTFLDGWDRSREHVTSAVLLTKGNQYYLAIMANGYRDSFKNTPLPNNEDVYKKIVYKQIPNAAKYLSSKQIIPQNPPQEIKDILIKKKNDSTSLTREEISCFIDYACNDFLVHYPSVLDEEGNNYFKFKFKNPNEYESLNEFFIDVDRQSYSIKYNDVPVSYINQLVDSGQLYLFRFYSKDFSNFSSGTPNLHTMYFKMLFDSKNLENLVYALSGGAEMFYRKASIKGEDTIVHNANQPISNKNPDNIKKESVFSYDIIKDRRYTERQFEIHIPIKMNAQANGYVNINNEVRRALHDCPDNYVIGIDRGERNLLYVCVIDGAGKIVEQFSLNKIINEYNDCSYSTNYHELLDSAEKSRAKARQDWKTINNISNIKEGYISQAVHKICELVEKYDAVIAMEDLNSGFKNSRVHVEKSVYQKFEKMLIDKLNFMVDKHKSPDEMGGLLNAYQLTPKFESFSKIGRQNGFIFYIPAWLTSKIDPTTGFANLLNTRFKSIASSKEFLENIDAISYNKQRDWFEFDIDYSKFPKCNADYIKKWTITSQGNRIMTFRNPEKNSEWDNKSINLTEEFKNLFARYEIDYEKSDIKAQLISKDEKEFFVSLMHLISLMLQMRNSITGTDVDYLVSPVMNKNGEFFCSDNAVEGLPLDADANGAFNIARKAQWAIKQIQDYTGDNLREVNISISNAAWLEYVQTK